MSTRSKKREKRRLKQSQKLAWMVELRLLGHNKPAIDGLRNAGNFLTAKRYYQMLRDRGPYDPRKWDWGTTSDHFVDSLGYTK